MSTKSKKSTKQNSKKSVKNTTTKKIASGSKTNKPTAPKKKTNKPIATKKKTQHNDLSVLFKKLKNVLRTSDDHVTGREATFAISQLVVLYLLEVTNKIEYFGLPEWVKFSKIYKICENDQEDNEYKIKASKLKNKIFNELQSNDHTKLAYTMDMPYKYYKTFKMLITEIHDFFESMDEIDHSKMKEEGDILGKEYEELLKTQLVGRDDGQYFTNRNAVKLIVEQINPQIGETVYDPTCGTGGFIIYAYMHMRKQITGKKIESTSDYKKLCEKTFFGCDLDNKIMEILHSNLILHDIKHNNHFKNCNTLTNNMVCDKYDVVLSNYPFGKKGGDIFNFDLNDTFKDYYGLKTNVLPLAFLKHTVNILNEDGRAGVIVTIGELTNNGKDYDFYRKMLVEENTLTKVIILPKGIFENAKGVSTAVLCFTKGGKTNKVEYYDVPNVKCDTINLIRTVTRKQIRKAGYSLDPQVFEEDEDIDYGDIPIMKLGDICEIKHGSNITKEKLNDGIYEVYGGGVSKMGMHDSYNRDEFTVLISKDGANAGYIQWYPYKTFITNHCMSIHSKNEKQLDNKYLYYIVKSIEKKFYKLQKGTAQPGIKRDEICELIKIPVPPISIQKKIVEYIDPLFLQIDNYTKTIETEKLVMKSTMKALLSKYPTKLKKIDDICEILYGDRITQKNNTEGKYPVYGGGGITFHTNNFNREGKTLIVSRFGVSNNCVRIIDGKFWLNDSGMSLQHKNKKANQSYINYLILCINDDIFKCCRGTAQKNINIDKFKSIQIQIPSIVHQEEIVQQMEGKQELVTILQKSISDAKENIKIIMNSYLKKSDVVKDHDKSESDLEEAPLKKSKKKVKSAESESNSEEAPPKKSKKKVKSSKSEEEIIDI